MNRLQIMSAVLALAFCSSNTAMGTTIWDENNDGDLSSDNLAPTPIVLGSGTNTIVGSVVAPSDVRDYITFEIAANQVLTGILLQNYQDLDTGGPGNRGFIAINEGDVSAVPAGNNSFFFLAGAHIDPFPAGTDLLTIFETQPLSGTGLTAPLGPGVYTFLIQQTGPQLTGYTLDFEVTEIPLPGAIWLFLGALATFVRKTASKS